MAQIKSDLKIIVEYRGKGFALNCIELYDGSFKIKRGRRQAEKLPRATATEIFKRSLSWLTAQRQNRRVVA